MSLRAPSVRRGWSTPHETSRCGWPRRSAAEKQSTIADVAAVAEQTSAATEQVSASAQQTSASVSEIASSASEMAANAQKLAELFAADQPAATAGTSGQAPRRASSAQ